MFDGDESTDAGAGAAESAGSHKRGRSGSFDDTFKQQSL